VGLACRGEFTPLLDENGRIDFLFFKPSSIQAFQLLQLFN